MIFPTGRPGTNMKGQAQPTLLKKIVATLLCELSTVSSVEPHSQVYATRQFLVYQFLYHHYMTIRYVSAILDGCSIVYVLECWTVNGEIGKQIPHYIGSRYLLRVHHLYSSIMSALIVRTLSVGRRDGEGQDQPSTHVCRGLKNEIAIESLYQWLYELLFFL